MNDLIFKRNGEEYFCIPSPFSNNYYHLPKCPKTQLEIKMTEPITLNLTLDELKLIDKYVEYGEETKHVFDKIKEAYPQPRMEYQESGTVDKVEYNGHTYLRIDYDDDSWLGGVWWKQIERHKSPMNIVTDDETRNILEGLWFNQVKKGVIDEPEHYDEVEWDEKDNPKPMDEVVERLMKKWEENPPEFLKFELGKTLEDLISRWWCDVFTTHDDWDMETAIDDLVDQIQLWLPREGSSEGSQDHYAIVATDAENFLLQKIKSKLRNKKA